MEALDRLTVWGFVPSASAKSAVIRKKRTVFRPRARISRKSWAMPSGSQRVHISTAVRRSQ
ncbi:MAG: hypothetical protein ISS50_01345 [Anaerolineae bacterium]|nr:hypothetical protein [Anaerolineae bacterium]